MTSLYGDLDSYVTHVAECENGTSETGNGSYSEYRLPAGARVTLFVLHMLVIVFILASNLSILGFIVKTRTCLAQGNVYIVSLTLANLLAGVISLPDAMMSDVTQVAAGIQCAAVHYCVLAADVAEVYTLVAIAYDRYVTVTTFRAPMTRDVVWCRFALRLTLCIWGAAFVYSSKAFFLYELIDNYYLSDEGVLFKISHCGIPRERRSERLVTAAVSLHFLVLFLIPAILIVTFYTLVYRRVHASALSARARRRNQRVLRVLIGVVTAFILLASPLELLNLYVYLGAGGFPGELLCKEALSLLSFTNFAVNSVIYVFCNDSFRRSFSRHCLRQNTIATATENNGDGRTAASGRQTAVSRTVV